MQNNDKETWNRYKEIQNQLKQIYKETQNESKQLQRLKMTTVQKDNQPQRDFKKKTIRHV